MSGLFHAYAKDTIGSTQYIITFANRDVADEWWRAILTPTNNWNTVGIVRVTPQFYTFNSSQRDISSSVTTSRFASTFSGRMLFTATSGFSTKLGIIAAPQDITDHISGNTFFIRSKSDQSLYWCCSKDLGFSGDSLYTSRKWRSRFRISIKGAAIADGSIMIGTDEVVIALARYNQYVGLFPNGELMSTDEPKVFAFRDLKSRFWGSGFFDDKNSARTSALLYTGRGAGEEWELVS